MYISKQASYSYIENTLKIQYSQGKKCKIKLFFKINYYLNHYLTILVFLFYLVALSAIPVFVH